MEQEERARVQRIRGRSVRTHFDVSGNLTGPYGARNDIYGKRKWERPRDIKAPGQANPEKLVVADLLCRYSYPQIIDEAPRGPLDGPLGDHSSLSGIPTELDGGPSPLMRRRDGNISSI